MSNAFEIGKSYLFKLRPSHFYVGHLVRITDNELVFKDAAWVNYYDVEYEEVIQCGTFLDVEPFPGELIVARAALVLAIDWSHPLPLQRANRTTS